MSLPVRGNFLKTQTHSQRTLTHTSSSLHYGRSPRAISEWWCVVVLLCVCLGFRVCVCVCVCVWVSVCGCGCLCVCVCVFFFVCLCELKEFLWGGGATTV